ncbi:hypothetical protein, partial [Labrys sp. 22185]|uniref:hypothetical protein n=1 Tax=Labrys sp. 22185 TaxID=3453888 RepID=UPI003F83D278
GGTVDLSNTDGNIVVAHNGPNATFDLAKSITLDSVTAGGNTLDATGLTVGNAAVTTNGLTITGGPSVTTTGIDAGSKAITNVAAGTNATDAVNVGQLQTVSNAAGNLGNSTASTLGGGTTYDPATGTLSGFSQTVTAIDGKGNVGTTTGYTTVAGALTQLDTNTTNLANAAVKYDDPAVKDKITLGNAGTPVTMTNLANGAVTAVSSDAVNGSQLYAVQQTANKGWNLSTNNGSTTANVAPGGTVDLNNTDGNIVISQSGSNATFNLASAITVATLTANSVTTGNATLDTNGLTITGGPSVTTTGIDAGGKKITNVAKGDVSSTSTDAVNGSQLFSLGNSVASGLGGGSSFDPSSGTVITSLNYGGSTFTSVQSVLDKIGGSINGGGIKYFHANSTDPDSVASGPNAVAIGPNSKASAGNAFAAGNGAQASAESSVAVGNGAEASGNDSIATGTQAKASGEGAIATGKNAEASGTGSTAMGSGSKATADGATAVGANSSATTANSTAIGNGAQASANEGDVALGAGSVTSTVVNTTGRTINGTPYTFAGTNATSTVSVGSAGNERTVTNVAAGQISATSTDAVNGSQLYATNQAIEAANQQVTQLGNNVNNLGTSTATTIGGGATYNSTTGKIENFSQGVTKIDKNGDVDANGPTQYSSVSDAMTQLDQNTTNLANAAVKYDDPSNKTKITLGGTDATKAVTLDNVANGEVSKSSKQAINGSQLYNSASSVAAALGGGSTVNTDGSISKPTYTVGGQQVTGVDGAISALDKRFDGIGGSIANLQSQVSNNLKEARQGISQAMAASALRYDDRPGKVSAAAGMAVYHRQVGLAAGLGWTSEDAKWRANIAGT